MGSKNRFWDNRFELNDELYYYDLRNYQVSGFDQALGGLIIVNAGKVEMYGNDLTLRFNATENDKLSLTLGLEKSHAIDFVISPEFVGAGGACDCNGYTLPLTPSATASVDYQHTVALPGGAKLVGDVSTYYSASYWDTNNHSLQTSVPAYTKTNVSVTYHSASDRWYASLWGRNLENHAHYGSISIPASQATPTTGFIDPPITFGGAWDLSFSDSYLRKPLLDAGAALAGRCLVAYLFVGAATYHLRLDGWLHTLADMQSRGVPAPRALLIGAMVFSSLASIALLLDVRSRWAAYALAGYTLVVSPIMHNPLHTAGADFFLFVKDLGLAGSLLMFGAAIRSAEPPLQPNERVLA